MLSLTISLGRAESFAFKSKPTSPLGPNLQGMSRSTVPKLPKLLNILLVQSCGPLSSVQVESLRSALKVGNLKNFDGHRKMVRLVFGHSLPANTRE
eukprot:2291703-Amphidinium_carterae.1